MGKTLFWYIFRDLLRVFLLSAFALVGIMSLCGLINPLSHHELPLAEVGKVFLCLMPVTSTYCLPAAVAFAATVVYGRLSRDEELTACRATGHSYAALTAPAWVLGIIVMAVSIVFLCSVVPRFTLMSKRIMTSNVAQLILDQIEQTHSIEFDPATVMSAQSARMLAEDASRPGEQRLELIAPMVTQRRFVDGISPGMPMSVPTEIQSADRAIAYFKPSGDDILVNVFAAHASRFSTDSPDVPTASVDTLWFQPRVMSRPLFEIPRFLTISRILGFYRNPHSSRLIRQQLLPTIEQTQQRLFVADLKSALERSSQYVFRYDGGSATLFRSDAMIETTDRADELILQCDSDQQDLRLIVEQNTGEAQTHQARVVRIRAQPHSDMLSSDESPAGSSDANGPTSRVDLSIEGFDVLDLTTDGSQVHNAFKRTFVLPMPPPLEELEHQTLDQSASSQLLLPADRAMIAAEQTRFRWQLRDEMHARAAFGLLTLLLAITGCLLGMIFRSGHFLAAGMISILPAVVGIVTIVTGQNMVSRAVHPTTIATIMIWTGNGIAAIFATTLLSRLRRQ